MGQKIANHYLSGKVSAI